MQKFWYIVHPLGFTLGSNYVELDAVKQAFVSSEMVCFKTTAFFPTMPLYQDCDILEEYSKFSLLYELVTLLWQSKNISVLQF